MTTTDLRPRLELGRNPQGHAHICCTEFDQSTGLAVRTFVIAGGAAHLADTTMQRRWDDLSRLMGDNVVPVIDDTFHQAFITIQSRQAILDLYPELRIPLMYDVAADAAATDIVDTAAEAIDAATREWYDGEPLPDGYDDLTMEVAEAVFTATQDPDYRPVPAGTRYTRSAA